MDRQEYEIGSSSRGREALEVGMVDVKWDFQGAAVDLRAAEQSVGPLLTFYKGALAGVTCPVHERKPWLKVQGRTVRDLQVTIEACCKESLHSATSRVDGVSRRQQQ